MLNLKIIVGSTRQGRAADLVVPWISRAAREHGAFDVDVLDLRDWQLPIFGETFRNKPAAFVAYSGGIGGGIRAVEHLAHVAIEAELVPLRNAVVIPHVSGAFDSDGTPVGDRTQAAAKIMLDDLAWWAAVLQRARRDGPLPPAIMRAKGARS